MALTNNPNKTKSIEKKWNREINRRWAQFFSKVKDLPLGSIVTNLDDEEQSEVEIFLLAFESLALSILLGGNGGEWQNIYQTVVYDRSAERAVEEAKSFLTIDELTSIFLFSISAGISILPQNRNELIFLHARANDKLNNWVQALIQDTNSIVHDNFGRLNRNELIDLIKKRLDVTKSRARTIATTEITQASQRAVTVQSKIIEEFIGEEVKVRWVTVRDSRVRHLHAGWHGKKFTPEQAEINFNISPWNCRCGLKTVVESRDSVKTIERFSNERKFLLARESKNLANSAN